MIKENKKLNELTYDEYAYFKSFECGYYGTCDSCPLELEIVKVQTLKTHGLTIKKCILNNF